MARRVAIAFCHCGNSSGNGAQGLNEAAGAAKKVFLRRTASTHAADLAARKVTAPKTTKHWNGVSAETCIPVDWGRLIPPYLHLMLGLVNDKVQRIYKELLALNGIDEEAAQRLSDLTVVAAEVRSKTNSSTKLKEYSTFSLLAILLLQVPLVRLQIWESASKTSPLVRGASSQMKPSRKPQRALLQEQLWPLGR